MDFDRTFPLGNWIWILMSVHAKLFQVPGTPTFLAKIARIMI